MPKGKRLTPEQRKEIYEACQIGESRKDIAEAYGIAVSSITKIVKAQRELQAKGDSVAHRECVVAGDKKNGRLTSTSDPHRYEGTCIVAGKANSRTFMAANAGAAAEMWRSWCNELRSKQPAPKVEPAKPVEVKQPTATEAKQIEKAEVSHMDKSIYVIWAKGDTPRLFGAYTTMDAALKEVDNLNEIASFLVSEKVFEVEELTLKS